MEVIIICICSVIQCATQNLNHNMRKISTKREFFIRWIFHQYIYYLGCGVRGGHKKITDHKGNVMSIETIPTNNNLSIDLNDNMKYTQNGLTSQNHVGHEYNTNSVLFILTEMPLELDQYIQPFSMLIISTP